VYSSLSPSLCLDHGLRYILSPLRLGRVVNATKKATSCRNGVSIWRAAIPDTVHGWPILPSIMHYNVGLALWVSLKYISIIDSDWGLVPYLITISIRDLKPGPRYLWCMLTPGINININNWGRCFTAICFVFCRCTSGDLVEPMSPWSASEYFILILLLSPLRGFMEILVGYVHCRFFCDFISGIC
jgi:hypothetical protein